MTFYEAALRVLEAAGQPLTSIEITERSGSTALQPPRRKIDRGHSSRYLPAPT